MKERGSVPFFFEKRDAGVDAQSEVDPDVSASGRFVEQCREKCIRDTGYAMACVPKGEHVKRCGQT